MAIYPAPLSYWTTDVMAVFYDFMMWTVIASAFILVACVVGGAIYDYRRGRRDRS